MPLDGAVNRARLVPLVVVSTAALVTLAFVLRGGALKGGFPLDDAWIHFVYGLAFRREGTLAYDDGIAATGCTSPLWAIVLGAVHLVVGADGPSWRAVFATKVLGLALHLGAVAFAARLAYALSPRRRARPWIAALAGVLAAIQPHAIVGAVSGMETALAALCALASLDAAARGRAILAGAIAGLGVAVRPELLVLVPFAALLVSAPPLGAFQPRLAACAIAAAAIPIVALVARTLAVSGRPLPATFYVKAAPVSLDLSLRLRATARVVASIAGFGSLGTWALLALALLSPLLARGARGLLARSAKGRAPRRLVRAAIVAGVVVAFVAGVSAVQLLQSPSLAFQRYLLPVAPLAAVSVALVAGGIVERARRRPIALDRACALAALALIALVMVGSVSAWSMARARLRADVRSIDAVNVAIGQRVAEATPKDAVVWTVDAGAVRYFGQRRTVDVLALNTPELVAARTLPPEWWPDAFAIQPAFFALGSDAPGAFETVLDVDYREFTPVLRAGFGQHALVRCRAERHGAVALGFRGQPPIVLGRCARRGP